MVYEKLSAVNVLRLDVLCCSGIVDTLKRCQIIDATSNYVSWSPLQIGEGDKSTDLNTIYQS